MTDWTPEDTARLTSSCVPCLEEHDCCPRREYLTIRLSRLADEIERGEWPGER